MVDLAAGSKCDHQRRKHQRRCADLGARSANGKWPVAYLASQPSITLNMAKITAAELASAEWIDPASGQEELIGRFRTREPHSFTRPQAWQDAVLVVKSEASVQGGVSQARNFVGDEPDP